MSVRCPDCNRFGKTNLGGRCKTCYDKKQERRKRRGYIMRDLHKADNGINGSAFIPGEFGIMKGKFGIETKNE